MSCQKDALMSSDHPLITHAPAHGHFFIGFSDIGILTVILVILNSSRRDCQGIISKESELSCQKDGLLSSDHPLDTHVPAHGHFFIGIQDYEIGTVI